METHADSTASHGRIEDPDSDRRIEQPVETRALLLQIPHSPTTTPERRRVARRTALTRVEDCPLLLDPVNALDNGRVSTPEAIEVHRQIVRDQHGEARRPKPLVRREVPETVRVRSQPALSASDEFSSGVPSSNEITGNNVPRALGPARRRGQPSVGSQGDARPGERDQLQRELPEPRSVTEVEVVGFTAEHVHGIGASSANTVDGYEVHEQPPVEDEIHAPTTATERRKRGADPSGRTTPSATTDCRTSCTEPPSVGTVTMA